MSQIDFSSIVESICKVDTRYSKEAYYFVRQSLDHTLKSKTTVKEGSQTHVTGQELLEGIRAFGLLQFGFLTQTVLKYWGVRECKDFGSIVFNLIEQKVFGKQNSDKKTDFENCYDFETAFIHPFLPKTAIAKLKTKKKSLAAKKSISIKSTEL